MVYPDVDRGRLAGRGVSVQAQLDYLAAQEDPGRG